LIYTQVPPYCSPHQIFIKINIPFIEIKNIDITEITEEHIFLGIYEGNSKESSVLNTIINMSKFSFWKSRNIILILSVIFSL
jgi:hypothetical protein